MNRPPLLDRLAARFGGRPVYVAFGALSSAASLTIVAVLASLSAQPLLLPSLGSTAFLIFNRPKNEAAAPRAIFIGHGAGVLGGHVGLVVGGLTERAPAIQGLSAERVVALAVAVLITTTAMLVLRAPHPPGAATALLVALGLLTSAGAQLALLAGVLLLVAQGYVLDHVLGIDYPLWADHERDPTPGG